MTTCQMLLLLQSVALVGLALLHHRHYRTARDAIVSETKRARQLISLMKKVKHLGYKIYLDEETCEATLEKA